MVEMERQSRIPENFICSSLSILPIFSARQLISWKPAIRRQILFKAGDGGFHFCDPEGDAALSLMPSGQRSIFCSGFSLPESGKVSQTWLTGLVVFSYRIFMTGSLSSTIASSPLLLLSGVTSSPSAHLRFFFSRDGNVLVDDVQCFIVVRHPPSVMRFSISSALSSIRFPAGSGLRFPSG